MNKIRNAVMDCVVEIHEIDKLVDNKKIDIEEALTQQREIINQAEQQIFDIIERKLTPYEHWNIRNKVCNCKQNFEENLKKLKEGE